MCLQNHNLVWGVWGSSPRKFEKIRPQICLLRHFGHISANHFMIKDVKSWLTCVEVDVTQGKFQRFQGSAWKSRISRIFSKDVATLFKLPVDRTEKWNNQKRTKMYEMGTLSVTPFSEKLCGVSEKCVEFGVNLWWKFTQYVSFRIFIFEDFTTLYSISVFKQIMRLIFTVLIWLWDSRMNMIKATNGGTQWYSDTMTQTLIYLGTTSYFNIKSILWNPIPGPIPNMPW